MNDLNWKDIRRIVNIADNLLQNASLENPPEYLKSQEAYYTEIANRFNDGKL